MWSQNGYLYTSTLENVSPTRPRTHPFARSTPHACPLLENFGVALPQNPGFERRQHPEILGKKLGNFGKKVESVEETLARVVAGGA